MEPDRKKEKEKKKSVLKHTLLSSSITDRTHKRAICQIPYARKGTGKDSGILVILIQESHTENTNSLNISNIKVCLMNLHKKQESER